MTSEKIKTFVDDAEKKLEETKTSALQKLDDLKDDVRLGVLAYKQQINIWIAHKVEESVMNVLEKARPVVKTKLKDEDMCDCVKSWVDDIVDSAWPVVMEEARFQL